MNDRLPPNSPEVEQRLLGCFMLAPATLLEIVSDYPAVEEFFYDLRHKTIFQAMRDSFQTDPISLQQVLRDRGHLANVGGLQYMASLMNLPASGSTFEAKQNADMLRDDYLRRRIIQVSWTMVQSAFESATAAEALEGAEKDVMDIRQSIVTSSDPDIKQLMMEALQEMDEALSNKGKIRGLRVGFDNVDYLTMGLKGAQVFVLAARPSVGKTSLAMNMAEYVAVDSKIPVGVFSLEMAGSELAFRMACARARVDSRDATLGYLKEDEITRMTTAVGEIASAPLHICDKGGLTILQLSARARRMVQRFNVKLGVIDYVQLMGTRNRGTRNDQITEISNGIKALAKDLGIPFIVISQLNREIEKADREPRMSDLRDSGSLEQDADLIGLLSPKGETYEKEQEVDLLIPKHRGGPVGKCEMVFHRNQTRYEAKTKTSDVPTGADI